MSQYNTKERFEQLRTTLFPDQTALLYKQNKDNLYDQNDKPETLFVCTCSDKHHVAKPYAKQFICPDCQKKWLMSDTNILKVTATNINHIQHYNIPNNIKTIVETTTNDDYISLKINTVINQFKIMSENNKQAKYRLQKNGKNVNTNDHFFYVDDRHVLAVFRHIYIKSITLIYNTKSKVLYKYVYDNISKQQRLINTSYVDFNNSQDFINQLNSQTENSIAVIGKINDQTIDELQTKNEKEINDAIEIMYKPWLDAVSKATGEVLTSLSDVSALLAYSKLKTLKRMIGRNKTPKEYLKALQFSNADDDDMLPLSLSEGALISKLPSNLVKRIRTLDRSDTRLNLRDMTKYLFPNASKNETKLIHTLYEAMSTNKNEAINILIIHFIYYAHMYIKDPHKRNTVYQTLIDNITSIKSNNIIYIVEHMVAISKLSITNKTKTRLYELLLAVIVNNKHNREYESDYIDFRTISNIGDTIQNIKSITKILGIVRPISTQKTIKQSIEEHITKIETNNPEHFENKINSMIFLINDEYPMLEEYAKEYYHDFDFTYDHIDQSLFTKQLGRFDLYLPESSYDLRRIGQLLSICVGNGYYADSVRNQTAIIAILKDRYSNKLTCLELYIEKTKNKKPKYILIQAKGPYNNRNFPLPGDVIHTIIDFCENNKIRIECHHDLKRPLKLKRVI